MEILAKITEWLKLSPKYLLAILICCSIFIFASDVFLTKLNILEFGNEYKSWIGFGFIGTLSILAVHILCLIKKRLAVHYTLYIYKKELKFLTPLKKKL